MRFHCAITFAALSFLAVADPHTASAPPDGMIHYAKGQTITVSTGYQAAPVRNVKPDYAFVLQKSPSDIPDQTKVFRKRATECASYYTASSGDTCLRVAKKNGLTVAMFMKINTQLNSDCSNLQASKRYCVKAPVIMSECTRTHKVTRTDSCTSIAKKYGISTSEFYKWNTQLDNNRCSNLRRGESYCVAQADLSTAAAAAADVASSSKPSIRTKAGTLLDSVSTKVTDLVVGERKKIQTNSAFTYYWIAHNEDYKGGRKVTIRTCGGATIGRVNENYADALVMEGTGVVDGKIVNLGSCSCSNYRCFEILDRSKGPYGINAYGTALQPYVSIAANDIPRNTKVYVPAIDGWKVPKSNKIHNGCLLVDDQSWSFGSKHIDLYVYEMSNYKSLAEFHPITKVDIYEGGNCKLLKYI